MASKPDLETLRVRMQLVSQRYRDVSAQLTDTSTKFAKQCLATRRRVAQLRATLDWYCDHSAGNALLRHPYVTLECADRFPQIEKALDELLRPIRENCRQQP
jgi:hypothetical protein